MITDNMLLIKTEIIDEVTTRNGRISKKLFNKVIVPHIKKLEKENQLLKDELEKERKVVDFYGNSENWESDEDGWLLYRRNFSYLNAELHDDESSVNGSLGWYGGKRARQRIKERKDT